MQTTFHLLPRGLTRPRIVVCSIEQNRQERRARGTLPHSMLRFTA
jgi:hypothetical protein